MATDAILRLTPLFEAHLRSKARMVDFAGWSMPVLYTSILEEARAVRNNVGMFDISHMGRTFISGRDATALLQKLTSNDVENLKPSEAQYSLLTNPAGGIIDDIIVYRAGDEAFMVVINSSNTQKDLTWIQSHATGDVVIRDDTCVTAMIAVQGPNAPALVADLAQNAALLSLDRFQYTKSQIGPNEVVFCRTGYTGEDGFELIMGAEAAEDIWNVLLRSGAVPCGLGARDALRIEAGYPLYGHEIDDNTSPVEAGLMWVVRLEKGEFIGANAIRDKKRQGPTRKLVGLRSANRLQPRQGYTVYAGDSTIGTVTSGIFSPTRNISIAMAYVSTPHARVGTEVEVAVRDKRIRATICSKKSLLEETVE